MARNSSRSSAGNFFRNSTGYSWKFHLSQFFAKIFKVVASGFFLEVPPGMQPRVPLGNSFRSSFLISYTISFENTFRSSSVIFFSGSFSEAQAAPEEHPELCFNAKNSSRSLSVGVCSEVSQRILTWISRGIYQQFLQRFSQIFLRWLFQKFLWDILPMFLCKFLPKFFQGSSWQSFWKLFRKVPWDIISNSS